MLEGCDTVSDIVHEANHMSIIIPIIAIKIHNHVFSEFLAFFHLYDIGISLNYRENRDINFFFLKFNRSQAAES